MTVPTSSKTPRGRLTLYAAAFVILVVAGALLGVAARDFLDNTGVLWLSTSLSALAIVLAVVALVAPRRR